MAPALHSILKGVLTLCAASVQLILKMLLVAEEDKEMQRTYLSALKLRHRMSMYEHLNHEPDQCLWVQKADADLKLGSRPVALISSLLRSFQAVWAYLICSLQVERMCLLGRSPSLWLHTTVLGEGGIQGNYSLFFFGPFSFPSAMTTGLQDSFFLHPPPKQWWKAQELQLLLLSKNN